MENQTNHPSRFVKWSLIVGIIIVINMFFNYAISLVYKAPEFPNNQTQVIGSLYTKESCLSVGGQWTENPPEIKLADPQGKYYSGYCNPDYTKQMQYEQDSKEYNKNLFMILVALGALIMGIGIVLKEKFEVIAIAFSWAGVLSFLIASLRYWSDANDLFRVIILAVALGALIYLAIKRFTK